MKDIAIYGFGGFGREIACLLRMINDQKPTWNLIGYFDDNKPIGMMNKYGEVLGGMGAVNNWSTPLSIVFSIATPSILKSLSGRIVNSKIEFPNIIAPNTILFDESTLKIGQGNVFMLGCRISCDVTIGDFNLVNGAVSFGHDVKIGNCNVLGPSTRLSGNVSLGNEVFFGACATVLQGIEIGSNARIGAGAMVMRKAKANTLYMGNPAKMIKI